MTFLIFFIYQFSNVMILDIYTLGLMLAFGIFGQHNIGFIIFM